MAIMPGANVALISKNYTPGHINVRGVILHTADSSANGHGHFLYWNRERTGVSSHFYVDYDGTITQLVDTANMSWTSGAACDYTLGIETQGWAREPWTPAQCAALARILRWAHEVHGVPLVAKHDSKRSPGIGYHRLGVPANRWQKARRRSQTGGELWSSAVGKDCPGDKRIAQIPGIITAATGGAVQAPTPAGVGQVKADGWFGSDTIRAAQHVFGTPEDGLVSSQYAGNREYCPNATSGWEWVGYGAAQGSQLIAKIQAWAGAGSVDGLIGPETIKAIQRKLGVTADGYMGAQTVSAFQNYLNERIQ